MLAIRARDPEPHRRPAPEAELPLLSDGARKDERPALHLEVAARHLADAPDADLEDGGDVAGQFDPRARGHLHRMPLACAASCRPSFSPCLSRLPRPAS